MLHHVPSGGLATPFVTHHDALGIDMFLRIALGAPEAADRRRRRPGVRDRPGVPQRGGVAATQPRVHDARAVSGAGRLRRHGRHHRGSGGRGSGAGDGHHRDHLQRTPDVAARPVAQVGLRRIGIGGHRDRVGPGDARGRGTHTWQPAPESRSTRRGGTGRIIAEVFEARVEDTIWEPTFVLDFPEEISPLARKHRSRPGLTERFEVTVAGKRIGQRLLRIERPGGAAPQIRNQAAARDAGDHEAHPMDEDFLRALEYGMPPPAGMGMGIDRLVMLLTDQPQSARCCSPHETGGVRAWVT